MRLRLRLRLMVQAADPRCARFAPALFRFALV
jgi:hypothetical protein